MGEEQPKTGIELMEAALNSLRARAVSAMIDYRIWLDRRSGEEGFQAAASRTMGALAGFLDAEREPSLVVRAVFGRRLPGLYAAGPDWVREHLPAMFPTAPNSQHLYDVAWSVYVIAWKPGLPLFQLLQEQYRKAVGEIDEATEACDREVRADPTSVVVRQITNLYVCGLEDEAGLSGSFDRLLERGSDSVRGVAIKTDWPNPLRRGSRSSSGATWEA